MLCAVTIRRMYLSTELSAPLYDQCCVDVSQNPPETHSQRPVHLQWVVSFYGWAFIRLTLYAYYLLIIL